MSRPQQQFLEVLDRDEAEARWREVVGAEALSSEEIALEDALGRVLAEDVHDTTNSSVDKAPLLVQVPGQTQI